MSIHPLYENININNHIKILVVDDDAMSHLTITTVFTQMFLTYETATNTTEALEKYNKKNFDLIITEINMKDSDGLAFIQNIRKKDKFIPIIVLSSYPDTKSFIELIQSDISGFVSKPIQYQELTNTITKTIEKIELKNTIKNQKSQLIEINNDLEQQMIQRISEIYALNEEIKETQREVIFTMGTVCENRSKETGNHVKRVTLYSEILAKYYGLEKEEILLLKEASPMHDIGKIAIPDAILHKDGILTEEERILMKTHTSLGYEMLKHSNRKLLQIAAQVAHEHHERYDGNGYPRRLKGEDISIYGRITALADVFDALGSDRCYKKAWDDEKIFEMIANERCKHFDPKLVDIFFDNLEEFFEVRENYKDIIN